jgi:hypothetical protein
LKRVAFFFAEMIIKNKVGYRYRSLGGSNIQRLCQTVVGRYWQKKNELKNFGKMDTFERKYSKFSKNCEQNCKRVFPKKVMT